MAGGARVRTVTRPRWRDLEAICAMHAALAAEHGLAGGRRRARRLERSLAEPRKLMVEGVTDARRIAASYCAAVVRARPFSQGNGALALAAACAVLRLGGYRLAAPEAEAVAVIRDLEAGEIGEPELEAWMARNAAPL
ncbi:MAG: Fic family protein [Alphaproteobacteria bacterium]